MITTYKFGMFTKYGKHLGKSSLQQLCMATDYNFKMCIMFM